MGRVGRRPVLDDEKRAQILAILSVGASLTMAAEYVGCAVSTIQRTAERDPKFAQELRHVKGNAEIGLLKFIRNAAKKEQYWRAAAWGLERAFPHAYARRNPRTLTFEQVAELLVQFSEILVRELPERARTKVLRHLDRMARSLGIELKREAPDDAQ